MTSNTERIDDVELTDAVELYLDDRRAELAKATLYSHKSRLTRFTEWCSTEDIQYISDIEPTDCLRFKTDRREHPDVESTSTLKTQLDTLRVFLRWCEKINVAKPGVADAVISPTLSGNETRDEMVDVDVATTIIDHLDQYEYASREHVSTILMWHCLLRRGGVRAIDLADCELDSENPTIKITHRPESDTPLKNKNEGERVISLAPDVRDVVRDWIDTQRPKTVDEHSRHPLVATRNGRAHISTIQADAYAVTRPCYLGQECPHNKDPEECAAACDRQQAHRCPSSKSPHAFRRGALTHWLRSDVPKTAIVGRGNVEPATLDRFYDQRSQKQKAEQRREYLDQI